MQEWTRTHVYVIKERSSSPILWIDNLCVFKSKDFPEKKIVEGLALRDRYDAFRASENKKELIGLLDNYFAEIKATMENIHKMEDEKILSQLVFPREKLEWGLEDNYDGILDTFGLLDERLDLGDFELPDFVTELKVESIGKDKLIILYDLLIKQYEKFKKIVNDHPLLTVFAHNYTVGAIQNTFRASVKEKNNALGKAEDLYALTLERLEKATRLDYAFDFFDMENKMLIHVENFWIALECFGLVLLKEVRLAYHMDEEKDVDLKEVLSHLLADYYQSEKERIDAIKERIEGFSNERLEKILKDFLETMDTL